MKKRRFFWTALLERNYTAAYTHPEHMGSQILRTDVRLPQRAMAVTNKYSHEF